MTHTECHDRPTIAPAVAAALDGLRRRIRQYVWFEGCGAAVTWLGVSFWASLAIDLFFEPPVFVRAIMLGIVAAVLGVVHAMGSLDSSPQILGGLIGAALVGTFSGILLAYAVVQPVAIKIKSVRQKQLRLFSLVKQSLLAFMNGAMPQVAVEFGRKTIPSRERPTIDTVENETIAGPAPTPDSAVKEAA